MNLEEIRKFAYAPTELDLSTIDAPEIDKDMVRLEREKNPIFAERFGHNYTKKLVDKFDYQYKHKQNVIINSWGQPRSTKTYSNISLSGQTEYPINNVDLIFFKIDDLNEYLPHLKPTKVTRPVSTSKRPAQKTAARHAALFRTYD
jgi:hypothetical protein